MSLWLWLVIYFRAGLCLQFVSSKNSDPSLQIKINNGLIQGCIDSTAIKGYPYYSYVGIPFARPPIGTLRFMRPKPMVPWNGILNATQQGPHCVEVYYSGAIGTLRADGVEDCLYLNVFTPQNPQNIREKLPVMVFIYGGAFVGGESNIFMYGPDHFMDQQSIIVVTFNYRTGILGFLSTSDLASPGNYGLKDQLAALKWVQSNINEFGGDPKKVTIYGESAGAASVIYHMQSPLSKGYFHRAISSSGSSLCPWAFQRNTSVINAQIAETLNLDLNNTRDFIHQLQNVGVQVLIDMTLILTVLHFASDFPHGLPFSPTIEPEHKHAFISKSSYETLEKGYFSKVPLLTGLNTMEMSLFIKFADLVQPLLIIFDLSPRLLPQEEINLSRKEAGRKILKHYFKAQSISSSSDKEFMLAMSDDLFTRPIVKTVKLISEYSPVYFYSLSFLGDLGMKGLEGVITTRSQSIGVAHGEDLWYLWKNRDFLPVTKSEHLTSQRMLRLWTNFVKTGNPTPTSEPLLQNITWPPIAADSLTFLEIDDNLSLKQNYKEDDVRFWDELYKNHSTGPYTIY